MRSKRYLSLSCCSVRGAERAPRPLHRRPQPAASLWRHMRTGDATHDARADHRRRQVRAADSAASRAVDRHTATDTLRSDCRVTVQQTYLS